MKRNYDVTPVSLRESARGWLGLYEMGIKSPILDTQIAAVFCLFFSFELYLKSYLVLKDKKFCREQVLIGLRHHFGRICAEVKRLAPEELAREVEKALDQYNLCENNIVDLRYPRTGRMTTFPRDLLNGKHDLGKVFEIIDREVDSWDRPTWIGMQ